MHTSIKQVRVLRHPWETSDPFLFCAYHRDQYPKGKPDMSPKASLAGRSLGQDFGGKDGWSMYHGTKVPGFPAHPHAGFETITIVTEGLVDHSDSLGAAGRFGNGDVQWMTAGKGVQHAEMFPLLNENEGNPFELFQIWLNLPKASKKVDPHYKMLWNEDIPVATIKDGQDRTTKIKIVAGDYNDTKALEPTPDSWAADPANGLAVWIIEMEADATFTLPTANEGLNRALFYYSGEGVEIEGKNIAKSHAIELHSHLDTEIKNGNTTSHFLLLQGKPMNEPVAQYGPFVANSQHEIQELMYDFQRTQFGGWPWESPAKVHPKERGRFALHVDGKEELKD